MDKEKYTGNDLDTFIPVESDARKAKSLMLPLFQGNDAMEANNQEFLEGFGDYVTGEVKKAEAGTTPPKDYRAEIVKDNYKDFNDRFYGNNDVMASYKSCIAWYACRRDHRR